MRPSAKLTATMIRQTGEVERGMDNPEAFGRMLRRLRAAHPLTQAALAQRAGCAIATVKKIEAGRRRPSPQLAARFADCLCLAGDARDAFLAAARTPDGAIGFAATRPSPGDTGGGLPQQVTSFVGREQEIALAIRILRDDSSRLLTLTGAGGCGKTRLALRVASDLADTYSGGVAVVELASLTDADLVPEAVAAALQIRVHSRASVVAQVLDVLRPRASLLVLDNCEHLLAACADLAGAILRTCPHVRILATSREEFGTAGETVYVIPSLRVPDAPVGREPTTAELERVAQAEAVRLFVARARSAWPEFALTAENAGALVRICHRVDGIPLALELAAARVRMLGVAEIAAYLDRDFRLLTGGRGAAPRHRTLQAAIDWSHDLLRDAERVLLRRLAVFAGGFTLEAARAVCADTVLGPDALLDLLARLVDQSLVLVDHDHRPARYRLLVPIRTYAAERLREAGETEMIQACHAHYFAVLAEREAPRWWGAEVATSVAGLQTEPDNLRAAVQWAVERGDAALGVSLARALCFYWYLSGVVSEGRRLVAGILAVAGASGEAAARAAALHVAGQLAALDRDFAAARGPLEESEAIYRRLGDRRGLAHSLNILGRVRLAEGAVAAAHVLLAESVALYRTVDDPNGLALALMGLAGSLLEQDEYAPARTCAAEVLHIYQSTGNRWGTGVALTYLGDVARCQGDYERAEELYLRSLALARDASVVAEIASILHNLGYVSVAKHEHARAEALFAEGLTMQREQGDQVGLLECLAGFGAVRAGQGQPQRAAVLFGAIDTLREAFGTPVWPVERIEQARHRERARRELSAGAWDAARAKGQHLTVEEAIAYALERADTDTGELPRDSRTASGGLTTREREVVTLVAWGKTNREIAGALFITERTVEAHIRSIRTKLDTNSRTQLAVWAVEHGLVTRGS